MSSGEIDVSSPKVMSRLPAEPVGNIAAIIEHAQAQLDKLGIGFLVNVRN